MTTIQGILNQLERHDTVNKEDIPTLLKYIHSLKEMSFTLMYVLNDIMKDEPEVKEQINKLLESNYGTEILTEIMKHENI